MLLGVAAQPLILIGKAHRGLSGPGDGKLLLRIKQPALIGHLGGGNFIGAEVLAGREGEHVNTATDLGAIDPSLILIG